MQYAKRDVLIVLTKETTDFHIAQTQHWYRIPVSTRLPSNLENKEARYIAFYFPKAFKEQKFSIRFYAEILHVEIVARKELFPAEPLNSKSHNKYYKISFGPLQELPKPIISYRGRRIIFIPTTWAKFIRAEEINELFHESPLEDKLWVELRKHDLPAERQFLLSTNEKNWICDFAFFCAKGNIDVECDGDTYHMKPDAVISDKVRNNEIASVADWDVLRFTTLHIEKEMDWTIQVIKRKIDKLGGLHYVKENTYRYVTKKGNQLDLFGPPE